MSVTTKNPVGVLTREMMKSSSQQMESMDEMAKKVEKLSNKRRNVSKQAVADKEPTPDSEVEASKTTLIIIEHNTQSTWI